MVELVGIFKKKLFWNCWGIAPNSGMKLHWKCSETFLDNCWKQWREIRANYGKPLKQLLWNRSETALLNHFFQKKNADFEQQQQKTKKRSDHQASIWVGTTTDWSTQVCVCVCMCVSVWVCEVWVGGNGATSCSQELPASRFSLGPRRPPFSHFFPFGFFWILFKKDIFGGGFYFCRVVRRLPPRRQLGSALVVVQCHVSIGHLAALSTFSAQFSHANFEFPYPPFCYFVACAGSRRRLVVVVEYFQKLHSFRLNRLFNLARYRRRFCSLNRPLSTAVWHVSNCCRAV